MPQYITLEEAKKHLYVDHDEDDSYILSLIDVAQETLVHMVNRPLTELELMHEGKLPTPLVHAMKMIVAKLYANREGDRSGRAQEIAFTLANLFIPYRRES